MYTIFKKFKKVRSWRGTSLLELTVVLAVMGTLATTVAVTFSGVRENSADQAALEDLRTFGNQVKLNGQSLQANSPGSKLVSGYAPTVDPIIPESFSSCLTSGATYNAFIAASGELSIPGAPSNIAFTTGPSVRTSSSDSAAASVSYSYCIAVIDGVETLGLATVSRADNCVFARGSIDSNFEAWSYGADLGGNCTGAVALFLAQGATTGGDASIGYIDPSLAGAPEAVTLLAAVGGTEEMTLSWESSTSSDTARYKVYSCANECSSQDVVQSANLLAWPTGVDSLETTLTVSGLLSGKNYRFAVVPVDATGYPGQALATNLVPTKPQAPSCPSVTTLDGAVTLNFSQFPAGHIVDSVTAFLSSDSGVLPFTSASLASGQVQATGLVNGQVYSVYAVATNSSGDSPQSCQRTVVAMQLPAQPQWATPASTVADTSVTLNWIPVVASAASPVSGYTLLTLNPSSGIYEASLYSASTSSATLTGLTSGVAQSYKISAYNDNANGIVSTVVTATPIAAPLAPVSVATGRTNLGGYISWSSVSSAGRPVEGFYAKLDGATIATVVYDSATETYSQAFNEATVGSPLVAGTTYAAQIVAFNTRNGVKVESSAVSFSFTAIAAPAQVTGLTVNPVSTSDTELRVAWTPLVSSSSNPVSQYAIMRLNNSSSIYELESIVAASVSAYTSSSLVSGVTYSYRVYAIGPVLDGPVSVTATGVAIGVPNQAVILASGRGDRLVSVNFSVSPTNAKPVTSIEVTQNGTVVDVVAASVTSYTYTDLTPGVTYTFGVRPTNEVGSAVLASTQVVAVTAPGVVTGLTIEPMLSSATSLLVSWTPVASSASGRVDGYVLETINPVSGVYEPYLVSGQASATATLTGLTQGVPSSSRVQAYSIELTTLSGGYSATVTATPIGLPAAPVVSSLVRVDSGFTISYSAPVSAGQPVSTVKVMLNASAASTTDNTGTSTLTASDVALAATPGTSYAVKVTSTNALGTTSGTTYNLVAVTAPIAPTSLSLTPNLTSLTSLDLAYQSVDGTTSAPVSGYMVEVLNNSVWTMVTLISQDETDFASAAALSEYVLSNLTAGVPTSVRMQSYGSATADLTSAVSATVTATPIGAPSPVVGLAVTGAYNNQMTFAWSNVTSASRPYERIDLKLYQGSSLISSTEATSSTVSRTYTGLSNGSTYLLYVIPQNYVSLNTNFGITSPQSLSTSAAPYSSPDTPSGLSCPVTTGSVVCSWSAVASTSGAPVTGYGVQWRVSGGSWSSDAAVTTGVSYTVPSPSNGVTYEVRVRTYGQDALLSSAYSTSVSVTPVSPPAAATALSASTGNTSSTLSWTPGTSTAASPIGYQKYEICVVSTGVCVSDESAGSSTASKTFTGLTNGTSYNAKVTSYSASSIASSVYNTVSAIYGPFTPYGPPLSSPTLTAVVAPGTATTSTGTVNLSFTAVAPDASGPVTGYAVYQNAALIGTTTSLTYSVTGLTNGTAYSFAVAAYNANAEGGRSATSTLTPYTIPSAPTVGAITRTSVSFTAPADNGGSAILDYTATCSNSTSVTGASSPITVVELPESATCTVRARNAAGLSPLSSATAAYSHYVYYAHYGYYAHYAYYAHYGYYNHYAYS